MLREIIGPEIRVEKTFSVWRTKGRQHDGGPQQVDWIFGYRVQNNAIRAAMIRVVFEWTEVSKDDEAPVFSPVAASLTSRHFCLATYWHRFRISPVILAGLPHHKQSYFRQPWIADFRTQLGPAVALNDF